MKSKLIFLTLLLSLTFIVGCDKEDDKPVFVDSIMQCGDFESELSGAFVLAAYIQNLGVNYYQLFLYSPGLSRAENDTFNLFEGEGNYLRFNFHRDSNFEFAPGVYTIYAGEIIGQIDYPWYTVGYNSTTNSYDYSWYLDEGKMHISKSGSIYTIYFFLKRFDGEAFNASYQGKLFIENVTEH